MSGPRNWGKKRIIAGAALVTGALLVGGIFTATALRVTSVAAPAQTSSSLKAPPPGSGPGQALQAREAARTGAPAAAFPPSGARAGATEAPALPSGQPLPPLDRMIVYTTSIAITVEDVAQAVDQVTALAQRAAGFVSASTIRQESEHTYATLTLRVPALAYNDTMTALRNLGVKVTAEQGQAKDVTEEFADLEAQVRNLQVTEAQLQELMKRATTIEEILKVQAQLNAVRGQIERLKGRMNYLQRNADLATITVQLSPAAPDRKKPESLVWDPLRIAQEAWDDSLRFLQVWAERGIRVAVFSWWLVPPALVAWAAWTTMRPRRQPAPQA